MNRECTGYPSFLYPVTDPRFTASYSQPMGSFLPSLYELPLNICTSVTVTSDLINCSVISAMLTEQMMLRTNKKHVHDWYSGIKNKLTRPQ
jgi:hypothetical protein